MNYKYIPRAQWNSESESAHHFWVQLLQELCQL